MCVGGVCVCVSVSECVCVLCVGEINVPRIPSGWRLCSVAAQCVCLDLFHSVLVMFALCSSCCVHVLTFMRHLMSAVVRPRLQTQVLVVNTYHICMLVVL